MNWYQAVQEQAVMVNLSVQGRVQTSDRDYLDLMNRLSTNKLISLEKGQGVPTLFLNANARIQEYVIVLNRGETALCVTGGGNGATFSDFLQKNIFWNDKLQVEDLTDELQQIGLAGKQASAIITEKWSDVADLQRYEFIEDDDLLVIRVNNLLEHPMYWLIGSAEQIESTRTWLAQHDVSDISTSEYDALRIASGLPAVGRELTDNYIPLEVGLWDAISFNKGCYTGQEIIARMDSRGKLARMMVMVTLDEQAADGTTLKNEADKSTGTLTSVAILPDDADEHYVGLAVIKTADAVPEQKLYTENGVTVTVKAIAGHYAPIYE